MMDRVVVDHEKANPGFLDHGQAFRLKAGVMHVDLNRYVAGTERHRSRLPRGDGGANSSDQRRRGQRDKKECSNAAISHAGHR